MGGPFGPNAYSGRTRVTIFPETSRASVSWLATLTGIWGGCCPLACPTGYPIVKPQCTTVHVLLPESAEGMDSSLPGQLQEMWPSCPQE